MNASNHFPANRTEALSRLKDFVQRAGREYAARRNFDLGAGNHRGVSTLSPYLRCRLITETDVLQAVLGRHSPGGAEKFIQEVFWRTYWKGWLEQRPAVWTQYKNDLARQIDAIQTQGGLRQRWQDACEGKTGIECFDHWAQELAQTGYLHNHARMWFASIWIFTLRLPWELGADFFLRHLLDGDPASNTLGWRWVAGIQTKGKTYLARASNIARFTEGRFDPVGQFAADAPPIDAPEPPARSPLPRLLPRETNLRTGFLLHTEDLSPGFAEPQGPCAVLRAESGLSPLAPAAHLGDFLDGCVNDTLARHNLAPDLVANDAETLVAWAADQGLEQIVTADAPVGPTREILSQLESLDSVRLVRVRRPFDSAAWPHATHGFFRFKEKIPGLLKKSGLINLPA